VHQALLNLPLSFFEGQHSGEVFARLTHDVGDVDRALGGASVPTNPADPTQYVPAVANPGVSYPIVGYTTWDVAQCYANAPVGEGIRRFLSQLYNSAQMINLVTVNGFSPVPSNLTGYIFNHLLSTSGDAGVSGVERAAIAAIEAVDQRLRADCKHHGERHPDEQEQQQECRDQCDALLVARTRRADFQS